MKLHGIDLDLESKSWAERGGYMVYAPTLIPVHHRITPALKAAAPGFPEAQRRLCFSDTVSRIPETTVTGDKHLFVLQCLFHFLTALEL